jgi:sugar O-acyltransferase (sialic acid O-acetyltransferase NeuD family)
MINILIFGGGNMCLNIINYLEDISIFSKKEFNIIGIVDPKKIEKKNEAKSMKKIKHHFSLKSVKFDRKNTLAIIAMGDVNQREKCRLEIKKKGIELFTLIHPTSYVSSSSKISKGCILAPFSLIGPKSNLEENVIVNFYASIGHHSFVGRSSVISPYATLNGQSHCGRMSLLGTNSVIMLKAKLGNQCKLGPGSILYNRTRDKSTYFGNPARKINFK